MPSWLGKLFAPRNQSTTTLRGETSPPPKQDAPQTDLTALKSQGDKLLGNGDFSGAQQLYLQVVAVDPDDIKSLYKLGFAQLEIGRIDDAKATLKRAAIVDPAIVDSWYLLGEAALKTGNTTQALRNFSRCLSIDPQFEAAYTNLCQILLATQRFDATAELLTGALQHFPHSAQFHFLLGNIRYQDGRFEDASVHLRWTVAIDPGNASAYGNLALAFEKLHQPEAGLQAIAHACTLQPECAEWHLTQGTLLQQCERIDAAIESMHRALILRGEYPEAHANLGSLYQKTRKLDLAESHYRQALRLRPDSAEYHFNLGSALQENAQFDAAVDAYDQALHIDSHHRRARLNQASCHIGLGNFKQALAILDTVIDSAPNHADAHWNKAVLLLQLGDFTNGWREYEYRWDRMGAQAKPQFSRPQWTGQEDIADKRIFLFAEQGFGDAIQFVRFATDVKRRSGATVVVEVPGALAELMRDVPGIDEIHAQGSTPNTLPFDFQCALMSLPMVLGTQLDTIPSLPYIRAAKDKVDHWKQQFTHLHDKRIGLVWAGNPKHENDHNRSMRLDTLSPLFDIPGLHFLSLQKDIPQVDRHLLEETRGLHDLSQSLTDYSVTAAIIANLDLVISVDTSVAHLAASMGKPVWILLPKNPDYRWMLDREDCPWYPSVRLFRQSQIGNWVDVMTSVRDALQSQFARPQ